VSCFCFFEFVLRRDCASTVKRKVDERDLKMMMQLIASGSIGWRIAAIKRNFFGHRIQWKRGKKKPTKNATTSTATTTTAAAAEAPEQQQEPPELGCFPGIFHPHDWGFVIGIN